MREFGKVLGFGLIGLGIYWLGKDIILTTQAAYYGWQTIPAAGSVVLMLTGLYILFNARASRRNLGWMLIAVAIALIFMSGGVLIRPTTLWNFVLGFAAIFGGGRLVQSQRLF
jgi:hypothetical protein